MSWAILNSDARHIPLRDESVQCVVTSPPYWGLRDYGMPAQIGLEKTPEQYVAKIVEVFREVRRVLRDDGTVWVNLGDSYAARGNSGGNGGITNIQASSIREKGWRGPPYGLKDKDLVGIPWRVAFALQQPYYTGTIKRVEDRIWLAAMIDGEGCMFIHKRKIGQSNGQGYERKHDTYGAGLEVANCHESIVKRCMEITGRGSICFVDKESRLKNRNQRLFRWNLRSNECRKVIQEVYPYLVGKQHEARLVLGCPSSGEDAERAHANLIKLHNGFPSDIDFPAPKPMYQPGFYLRSDIIWSKLNPMPESVTDRPTKSHEYIFLLSKNERYYFDQDAVREQANGWNGSKFDDPRDLTVRPTTGRGPRHQTNGKHSTQDPQSSGRRIVENVKAARANGADHDSPFGDTRNIRSVWTIATRPYADAHFATFPEELAGRCIKAGSKPGDIILDPFSGAGTTPLVSDKLNRIGIGTELKPEYCKMSHRRCYDDAPLFVEGMRGEINGGSTILR